MAMSTSVAWAAGPTEKQRLNFIDTLAMTMFAEHKCAWRVNPVRVQEAFSALKISPGDIGPGGKYHGRMKSRMDEAESKFSNDSFCDLMAARFGSSGNAIPDLLKTK
jgi:hypothetical protein